MEMALASTLVLDLVLGLRSGKALRPVMAVRPVMALVLGSVSRYGLGSARASVTGRDRPLPRQGFAPAR